MSDSTITLSDGRRLGYKLLGQEDGQPAFFFHGTPGSRLVLSEDEDLVRLPGVRWIVPDRPGYGLSDPKPERTLLDWPQDVAELADHLGLGSYAVVGDSGGGPHALACGARPMDRVTQVLLLASPAPANFRGATRGLAWGNRIGLFLGRYAPAIYRVMVRASMAALVKDPDGFVQALGRQMSVPDQRLLEDPELRRAIARDVQEAFRQGGEGQVVDGSLAMTSGSWGFELRDIQVPVHLWHGVEDVLVSRAMAERLAQEIPHCRSHFVRGAGHLLTEVPEVVEQVGRALQEDRTGDL